MAQKAKDPGEAARPAGFGAHESHPRLMHHLHLGRRRPKSIASKATEKTTMISLPMFFLVFQQLNQQQKKT